MDSEQKTETVSPRADAERIDFADLCQDLGGIVCDYPYCDPALVLQVTASDLRARAEDGGHPARDDAPGLLLALHAASWYAVSGRIDDPAVVDSMIEAVERAATGYEAGACPHPGGEGHPDLTDESPDSIVDLILPLYDEEEWKDYYGTDFAEGAEERAGWFCPGFIRGIAESTLATLRDGRDELFGPPDIDALERVYLKPDGRADISRLIHDAGDAWYGGSPGLTEKASVLAAHRMAHGAPAEERLPLLLTVGFAVQNATWEAIPPKTAELYHRALESVDQTPLAAPCPHSDGHPEVAVEAKDWARLARALHDPSTKKGMTVDEAAVRCPKFAAERAAALLRVTGEHLTPGEG
ncbi:hypothetical protein NE236_12260 [Actinoallomurus purpureus]|uniref:hypothetical protein n=1 Tax=Actinoallomurus purpureus TaxID=478114 RepID=UPI002093FB76|nr:hypothetical protein [Actinoallomurus purpureus]MCO6005757.1 hypothetical protein [Actinoallomurus purpureus]